MQVKYLMIQQDLNTNFNFLAHVKSVCIKNYPQSLFVWLKNIYTAVYNRQKTSISLKYQVISPKKNFDKLIGGN